MARRCTSGKYGSYPSRQAAQEALARILTGGGLNRLVAPCRAYRCPCGRWHLTSQPASKKSAS